MFHEQNVSEASQSFVFLTQNSSREMTTSQTQHSKTLEYLHYFTKYKLPSHKEEARDIVLYLNV